MTMTTDTTETTKILAQMNGDIEFSKTEVAGLRSDTNDLRGDVNTLGREMNQRFDTFDTMDQKLDQLLLATKSK